MSLSISSFPRQHSQQLKVNSFCITFYIETTAADQDQNNFGAPTTPSGGFARSFTVVFAKLLTEQDLNKVRDKFMEDIDFVLEEAIRKHVRMIT